MDKQLIIALGREVGSGGHEIAKRKQLHPGDVVKIIDIGEYEVVRED